MNKVSIIINGVRYDAVEKTAAKCVLCDLQSVCNEDTFENICYSYCPDCVFKKSDKKFEK